MKVSEETLLESGFSHTDVLKIKSNVENFGGSMGDTLRDLANRFVIALSVVAGCLTVFVLLVLFGSAEILFSGSVGLFCGIAVAIFLQPPVLAYKCWRYQRLHRR